jgi:hypothetical protein
MLAAVASVAAPAGPGAGRRYEAPSREAAAPRAPARRSDTATEALVKSLARTIGSTAGRQIVRGVLGSLFKGR